MRISVTAFPHDLAFLFLATDWGPTGTPFGPIGISPYTLISVYGFYAPWSVNLKIPPFKSLHHLGLTGQLLYTKSNKIVVGNPSGTWISR